MASTEDQLLAKQPPNYGRLSADASPPPEYDCGHPVNADSSRACLDADSSTESLPQYEETVKEGPSSSASTAALEATHVFQIEAQGHPFFALPTSPRADPITVYTVTEAEQIGALAYQSIRETRDSGNCVLVRAGDGQPVCSTTYRFGPNRPPKILLLGDSASDEAFEVRGKGCHTRAQVIRTHLGTFQWRYAGRAERKAAGASCLLILDLVTSVVTASGKQEERQKAVAHFIRNDTLRTQGTSASTAGNGGRLLMDLRSWLGGKMEAQQAEVLAIASCITMLKKEVDRRRLQQFIVIAGGASGGGP